MTYSGRDWSSTDDLWPELPAPVPLETTSWVYRWPHTMPSNELMIIKRNYLRVNGHVIQTELHDMEKMANLMLLYVREQRKAEQ